MTFGTLDDLAPGDYSVERGEDGAELILKPSLHTGSIAASAAAPGVPGVAGVTNRVDGLNLGFSGDLTLFDKGSYNHALIYARPTLRAGIGEAALFARGAALLRRTNPHHAGLRVPRHHGP